MQRKEALLAASVRGCSLELPPLKTPEGRSPYVSAKRTHRFLAAFLMEHSLYVMVALELFEEIRWVRFGKRTQKWGGKTGGRQCF